MYNSVVLLGFTFLMMAFVPQIPMVDSCSCEVNIYLLKCRIGEVHSFNFTDPECFDFNITGGGLFSVKTDLGCDEDVIRAKYYAGHTCKPLFYISTVNMTEGECYDVQIPVNNRSGIPANITCIGHCS